MHLNDETEILIDRCVDDELNADDTRALMMDMDSVDGGWKTLACRFLEERMLRQQLQSVMESEKSAADTALGTRVGGKVNGSGSAAAVRGGRNWFGHPMMSLSLCAAIAFVSGLLIPRTAPTEPTVVQHGQQVAPVPGAEVPTAMSQAASGGETRGTPQYTLEWTPDSGQRETPLQIPVFMDVNDLAQELAVSRQRSAEGHGFLYSGDSNSTRVMRIQLNDSEDILLFVEEQKFGLPLQ